MTTYKCNFSEKYFALLHYEFCLFFEFLLRLFRRPFGDGVPLDEDSPGVFRLYESRMLKNKESPLGFGFSAIGSVGDFAGEAIGETFTEEGHVETSFFESCTISGSDVKNFRAIERTAIAANPPAAASATGGSFICSFITINCFK
jgi:hypothetical protein